ncbi:hypothetical protein MWN34_17005 [Ancylobacter sp. 6x-1]|uniref:Uncharacterized protein n=1 Tax=Ancylobacter crimeensis TaxID=2579147 RepID=A0ABT0DFV0_9HYPH|nr:hypothetical protein [Ancylobacter crimeensis]MCK0198602.1 hypothetical protein [Ancylobacter crimeensis]
MTVNWQMPLSIAGVSIICLAYAFMVPGVSVLDLCAGAGLGGSAMWAISEYETATRRRRERPSAEADGAGNALPLVSQRRAATRADSAGSHAARPQPAGTSAPAATHAAAAKAYDAPAYGHGADAPGDPHAGYGSAHDSAARRSAAQHSGRPAHSHRNMAQQSAPAHAADAAQREQAVRTGSHTAPPAAAPDRRDAEAGLNGQRRAQRPAANAAAPAAESVPPAMDALPAGNWVPDDEAWDVVDTPVAGHDHPAPLYAPLSSAHKAALPALHALAYSADLDAWRAGEAWRAEEDETSFTPDAQDHASTRMLDADDQQAIEQEATELLVQELAQELVTALAERQRFTLQADEQMPTATNDPPLDRMRAPEGPRRHRDAGYELIPPGGREPRPAASHGWSMEDTGYGAAAESLTLRIELPQVVRQALGRHVTVARERENVLAAQRNLAPLQLELGRRERIRRELERQRAEEREHAARPVNGYAANGYRANGYAHDEPIRASDLSSEAGMSTRAGKGRQAT